MLRPWRGLGELPIRDHAAQAPTLERMGLWTRRRRRTRFSAEVRERAVREWLRDHQGVQRFANGRTIVVRAPRRLSCTAESLRRWLRQAEQRCGDGDPARRRMNGSGSKRWSGKTGELRQAERDSAQGVGLFCQGGARPPVHSHDRLHRRSSRGARGQRRRTRPARVLPIAPSSLSGACGDAPRSREGLGEGAARCGFARENPGSRLRRQFRGLWRDRQGFGGSLLREGESVARCTVERLMRAMGLQGVVRGKAGSERR